MVVSDGAPAIVLLLGNILLGAGIYVLCPILDVQSNRTRLVMAVIAVLLGVRYLVWRWGATVEFGPPLALEVLWPLLFIAVETARFTEHLHAMLTLSRTTDRVAEADRHEKRLKRLTLAQLPRVDVFIPTYDEPEEVLLRTLVGVQALDYPHVRIFVLDDKSRPWVEELCRREHVHYRSRLNGPHAKAGNLNHGLATTAGPDAAPFILMLDADFVPFRRFLWRTLGFFEDPKIAVVQTPQYFFNPDPPQMNLGNERNWSDEQRFFFDVFQPSKDAWNTAFCCGSSCIARRDALEAIGGFPTGAVIEDIHLSYKLMAEGWITRYLNETLSNGMAAETIGEFVGQRARWALGCVQALTLPSGPLSRNGLTLMQRSHYLSTVSYWLGLVFLPMWVLAPALYWLFGLPAFHADIADLLLYQLPYGIVSQAFMIWTGRGRLVPLIWEGIQLVFAVDSIRPVYTLLLTGKPRVTAATRKGLHVDRQTIEWRLLLMLLVPFIATIVGLIWGQMGNYHDTFSHDADQVNVIWGLYSLGMLTFAMLLCIEVPRRRQQDRFDVKQMITLEDGRTAILQEASTTGMRLTMADAPTRVTFEWGGIETIHARLVRRSRNWGSYKFEVDPAQQRKLIVQLYTGGFRSTAARMNLPAFLGSVAGRLLLRRQGA